MQELIEAQGLALISTQIRPRQFVEAHMGQVIGGRNPIRQLRAMQKVRPMMQAAETRQAEIHAAACEGSDAIIGHWLLSPLGLSMAAKLGVPYIEADVKPIVPTREFPMTVLPPLPLGGSFNRLSHLLFEKAMWQMQRTSINTLRTQRLGLPPEPLLGYHGRLRGSLRLRLCGASPHVLPRPAGWPEHVHMTGYWTLPDDPAYEPPAALVAFLESGPPPVYVGFGSMPSADPAAVTGLIVRALELAGQRGVLYAGWGGMSRAVLPDSVLMIDSVPHSWLFPRMAAVVHHGGAGTTAAGLRAGVPTIVLPQMGDQAFWGRRVHLLGAGPAPIPRQKLTAGRLAEAIRAAVSNAEIKHNAAALGEALRAEDGVGKAVEIITGLIRGR
jgi:UDP:flavonoid glycosyltransferase YjiC (YdhE family)